MMYAMRSTQSWTISANNHLANMLCHPEQVYPDINTNWIQDI